MAGGIAYADSVKAALQSQGQDLSDLQRTRIVLAYESGVHNERERIAGLLDAVISGLSDFGSSHPVKDLNKLLKEIAAPI